ncbi:hypothetical protein FAES_3693 [Fibrella aestuarina BUZ 2]|uniref:Transporter n=1 Tax=Fibrella aestuarina BUZ 2 TaxID=1166018 RepID=I0KC47_9BACT|nr:hypothetical protein [Fibrella aestuarina]CCH01700.1 hypothetical protein FAES_3693 [Fibrella aestuarina BUZ 2]
MKRYLFILVLVVSRTVGAWAQMPQDAIYMPKKSICVAAMYGKSDWNWYWENTLKRENYNIGTHTTQSASLMAAVGLSNRVNLIVNVPYVWTSASAGNLLGQRGFQDLSGWLKVEAVRVKEFSLHGIAGVSTPLSSYVPNFLPMSIGMGARTVSGRLLANYRDTKTGLYATAHGTYTWRGNIRIDQDSYQADNRVYNTNEVAVPNAADAALRLGILRRTFQTEVFVERFTCLSGDNIRRNDMPFPTNNMQATTVGWYGKYQPHNVGFNARVGYVTNGLNMGQSTAFTLGLLYQINLN